MSAQTPVLHLSGKVVGISLLFLSLTPRVTVAQDTNPDEVRRQIASIWGGFESVKCLSVEQIETHAQGDRLTNTIDFAWKVDGRSRSSQTIQRENRTNFDEIRDDGTRWVRVHYFEKLPKTVNMIQIEPTSNQVGHYGNRMFTAMWMFLPGGQTIATILDEGGTLANSGSASKPRWMLTTQLKHSALECDLDETHQFLPREMTIRTETSQQTIRVDRFEQSGDFWYPAAGSSEIVPTNLERGPTNISFELQQVAINQPIAAAKFRWSDFPAGALVVDQVKMTRESIGGKLARIKLTREHAPPKQAAPHDNPIQIPTDPAGSPRFWVTGVLLSSAILAGGAGLYLRYRGF